jgi:hypothetical protein
MPHIKLLSLSYFGPTGCQLSIGAPLIAFFPDLMQELRRNCQADCPLAIADNIDWQFVRCQMIGCHRKISRFQPHVSSHVDTDRGFSCPGDPYQDDFGLVITAGSKMDPDGITIESFPRSIIISSAVSKV